MVAITKVWTPSDPTRQDPGVPITSAWGNDTWDNIDFLKEWIGAGFIAGAAQDHNHDGVNSAKVNIFPNLMPGGSFEDVGATNDPVGWSKNEYVGGTVTTTKTTSQDGERSLAITSTIQANGGGQLTQDEYKSVSGGHYYPLQIYRWASVANVSSRIELIWYDATKTQISITTVLNEVNTPLGATVVSNRYQAPANARFVRTRLTGGVPATGSAVGTVYFDGGYIMSPIPLNSLETNNYINQSVTEPKLGTSAVSNRVIGPLAVTDSKLNKAISINSSIFIAAGAFWTPLAGYYNMFGGSASFQFYSIDAAGWLGEPLAGTYWFDGANMRVAGASYSVFYQKLG